MTLKLAAENLKCIKTSTSKMVKEEASFAKHRGCYYFVVRKVHCSEEEFLSAI